MVKSISCLAAIAALLPGVAAAEVAVCVTVSATGTAASLGVPEQNTVQFLPEAAGGQAIRYIVYDDASDPTAATRNARKCIEDDKADVIIGSSTAPNSVAAGSVAAEARTPIISLAAMQVPEQVGPWLFHSVQSNEQMAKALIAHMEQQGVKKLAFIGYSDAYGEGWLNAMTTLLEGTDIELGPVERFARADTSVTGQILRIVSSRPDAVLIGGSGTPSALPATTLRERGFTGLVYQTHGSATMDFIRVGGRAVEGNILPVGPVVLGSKLPTDHPSFEIVRDYIARYESIYGAGSVSAFGGMMYDAGQLVAAAIPGALEAGAPGTPEFRAALRDELEGLTEVVSANGIYNMSVDDHYGHDERSSLVVQVKDGQFEYIGTK